MAKTTSTSIPVGKDSLKDTTSPDSASVTLNQGTWGINPITILIILLTLNFVNSFVPPDLKKRLRDSWNVFWPPWQDRSAPKSPSREQEDSLGASRSRTKTEVASVTRDANSTSATKGDGISPSSEKVAAVEKKERSVETTDPESRQRYEKGSDGKREAAVVVDKTRAKEIDVSTASQKVRTDSPDTEKVVFKEHKQTTSEIRTTNHEEQRNPESSERRTAESRSEKEAHPDTTERRPKADLTESERAQIVKERSSSSSRRPASESEQAQRMVAEVSTKASLSESERARVMKERSSSSTKESLSESEKARMMKDKPESSDIGSADDARSKDKGKARMEGERPREDLLRSVETVSVSKVEDTKKQIDKSPDGSTSSIATKTETKVTTLANEDKSPSPSSESEVKSPSSTDATATSDSDTDALMSGDYRPLKSALKKSKKKPRQHKNIHHNFFMTMRGYRPALIPFPHGFHPKPHHARNSLWWDNVPKNAEHIMAAPAVPKQPAEDGEGEDEKGSTSSNSKDKASEKSKEKSSEKDKDKEKKEGTTKSKESDKEEKTDKYPRDAKPKEKESSGDKDKEKEKKSPTDKDKEKEKEKARLMAEAEAKAKARKEAEAKAARTSSTSSATASSSRPSASAAAAVVAEPPAVPLNPQIQKATYVSQGFLCILLYYVHQQLGFLLLVFFVWQYIDAQNAAAPASLPAVISQRSASSSSAPSTERETSRIPSNRKGEMEDKGDIDPRMKAKLEEARRAKEASSKPRDEERSKELTMSRSEERVQAQTRDEEKRSKEPTTEMRKTEQSSEVKTKSRSDEVSAAERDKMKDELARQLRKMDEIVRDGRNVEDPSDEQKARLKRAEEKRNALRKEWSKLTMSSPEAKPTTEISDSAAKKRTSASESASHGSMSEKMLRFKEQMKEIEAYILKYRKIEEPNEEQITKLRKAEEKRKMMKRELAKMMESKDVGGSGLTPEEKEALSRKRDEV
nr:uncharacterized protein CI109_005492 [Kwoniella shandongensis]KAA5526214.1 hypothetical protein CI109_005492 [Kwoniella shandongensis]